MGIPTVCLAEDEQRVLARRSHQARMKPTYVSMLIREQPPAAGADVLADAIDLLTEMADIPWLSLRVAAAQ